MPATTTENFPNCPDVLKFSSIQNLTGEKRKQKTNMILSYYNYANVYDVFVFINVFLDIQLGAEYNMTKSV